MKWILEGKLNEKSACNLIMLLYWFIDQGWRSWWDDVHAHLMILVYIFLLLIIKIFNKFTTQFINDLNKYSHITSTTNVQTFQTSQECPKFSASILSSDSYEKLKFLPLVMPSGRLRNCFGISHSLRWIIYIAWKYSSPQINKFSCVLVRE